jgi:hypothetical protein
MTPSDVQHRVACVLCQRYQRPAFRSEADGAEADDSSHINYGMTLNATPCRSSAGSHVALAERVPSGCALNGAPRLELKCTGEMA